MSVSGGGTQAVVGSGGLFRSHRFQRCSNGASSHEGTGASVDSHCLVPSGPGSGCLGLPRGRLSWEARCDPKNLQGPRVPSPWDSHTGAGKAGSGPGGWPLLLLSWALDRRWQTGCRLSGQQENLRSWGKFSGQRTRNSNGSCRNPTLGHSSPARRGHCHGNEVICARSCQLQGHRDLAGACLSSPQLPSPRGPPSPCQGPAQTVLLGVRGEVLLLGTRGTLHWATMSLRASSAAQPDSSHCTRPSSPPFLSAKERMPGAGVQLGTLWKCQFSPTHAGGRGSQFHSVCTRSGRQAPRRLTCYNYRNQDKKASPQEVPGPLVTPEATWHKQAAHTARRPGRLQVPAAPSALCAAEMTVLPWSSNAKPIAAHSPQPLQPRACRAIPACCPMVQAGRAEQPGHSMGFPSTPPAAQVPSPSWLETSWARAASHPCTERSERAQGGRHKRSPLI